MSTEREESDSAEKHGPVNYWWFEGDSVAELLRQLNEAGPTARLEVRPHGRKILLHVLDGDPALTGRLRAPINESHPCPPFC